MRRELIRALFKYFRYMRYTTDGFNLKANVSVFNFDIEIDIENPVPLIRSRFNFNP